jgi:hypothetical protein
MQVRAAISLSDANVASPRARRARRVTLSFRRRIQLWEHPNGACPGMRRSGCRPLGGSFSSRYNFPFRLLIKRDSRHPIPNGKTLEQGCGSAIQCC